MDADGDGHLEQLASAAISRLANIERLMRSIAGTMGIKIDPSALYKPDAFDRYAE